MNKSCRIFLFVLITTFIFIFLISGFSNTSFAQQAGCITSKCHSGIDKDKYVHGPIAAGECIMCHGEPPANHNKKPKKNSFKEIEDVAAVCYACHDAFAAKKSTHAPVEAGECAACHDPHGSPYKFQLIEEGGKLCFNCHDDEIVAEKFVHGPAAVGGCIACHEAHTSNYDKNLKEEGPALCYTCHTDKSELFKNAKVMHTPVADDCVSCHNPHSAPKDFMLSDDAPELCYGCHTDIEEWVGKISNQHGAIFKDKSCLNCHEPHVSNIPKILSKPPMELCLSCHDQDRKTKSGVVITNIKKLLKENSEHHGPIKQKDCSACHNTHGSDYFRMLREHYPATFYEPFSVQNYGLCFSCHEDAIVRDMETTTLTNFRNGKMNLHFKHVNKPSKGRVCRSCHQTHASNYPKHIREAVPFGSWEVPLNFNKTETGGSCLPGCHKLKKYDRTKMEINE